MKRIVPLIASLALLGCESAPHKEPAKQPPPAVVTGGVKEIDLATVHLTKQAEERLGIQLAAVEVQRARRTRSFAGEVVVPPGQVLTLAAPVAGTISVSHAIAGDTVNKGAVLFRLLPLAGVQRDLRATAEADVAASRARVEGAKQRKDRAEQLLRDEVGSVRQKEIAEEELRVAEANLKAAQARLDQIQRTPLDADVSVTIAAPQAGWLRQVMVTEGQMVPGGAPLAEIARLDSLWVRVPVYAGELAELDTRSAAEVRPLGQETSPVLFLAAPVAAPPSADPLANSVDLYYKAGSLRPGQRLNVSIPLHSREEGLAISTAAILHDMQGGAWVYEYTAPQTYVRRRVEIRRVENGLAFLRYGPASGSKVVTTGSAELFGTEFGAGK